MNSTEIAKAVVMELFGGVSVWLLLFASALFAGIGAYFGKYLGIKGADLATRENFDSLQNQLSDSTRLVEKIRSDIAQTDWVEREWCSLRIKKIEELMTLLHECEEYLTSLCNASIECKHYPNMHPFNQAIAISEIYLPELEDEVSQFIFDCRKISVDMINLAQQGLAMKQDGTNIDTTFIWKDFVQNSGYSNLPNRAKTIRIAAGQLLKKIASSP